MTKNVLLAGVSALALALSATVAFADGDSNTATNGNNNINTQGGTQSVAGNGSNNTTGVETNSQNASEDNTNALNSGAIAGGSNNFGSGNTLVAGFNGSGNSTTELSSESLTLNDNESQNFSNSASFSGASQVTANVLNSTVALNTIDYNPANGTQIQGNVIDSDLNSFTGAASLVQNNGVQNNVQAALAVNVGTVNGGLASR